MLELELDAEVDDKAWINSSLKSLLFACTSWLLVLNNVRLEGACPFPGQCIKPIGALQTGINIMSRSLLGYLI